MNAALLAVPLRPPPPVGGYFVPRGGTAGSRRLLSAIQSPIRRGQLLMVLSLERLPILKPWPPRAKR
jgi:hypothetical protein